jgi:hypothetical protein
MSVPFHTYYALYLTLIQDHVDHACSFDRKKRAMNGKESYQFTKQPNYRVNEQWVVVEATWTV